MSRTYPQLKDLPQAWFAQVAPLWIAEGGPVALETQAITPHGGLFHCDGTVVAEPRLGERIEVEFRKPDRSAAFSLTSQLVHVEREGDGLCLGLMFLRLSQHTSQRRTDEALREIIPCPPDFLPLAWGLHPWFFNYRTQFHVAGFFRHGMRLRFAPSVRGVIEGLALELCVVLPGIAPFTTTVLVGEVDVRPGAPSHTCDVTFLDPSPELLDSISRYLFMAVSDLTPESLVEVGYPFPELGHAAVFHYAFTEEEQREVMALRLEAYQNREGSTLTGVTDPLVMRDAFDAHSLLLSLRISGQKGGKMVGTTRLVFNDGDKSKSEIARFVELPTWLWEAGFVELSRSATIDYIRGRDVFANLRRHALRVAFQAGFRYILADCEGSLLEPYKRRGAQELGVRFVHPLENKTLHVLYYDIDAILRGEVGDRELWERFWKPMAQFLQEKHRI